MRVDELWMENTYDAIVAESGDDGITSKECREEFAKRYDAAIESGELERDNITTYEEGLGHFDRDIKPKRRARSRRLQDSATQITEALNDETILGRDDPILHQAVPLGDLDGRDKIIGLWTAEDWRNATITRYRKAADMTAAASAFDYHAQSIIAKMLSTHGIQKTFDLFKPTPQTRIDNNE